MSGDASHDFDAWLPTVPADALTLHLWNPVAQRLRGWAVTAGLDDRGLPAVAFMAGAVAFLLFWKGHFGPGLVAAVAFLVTAQASEAKGWAAWASALLPLLWWWAWWHGLVTSRQPLAPLYGLMILWAALGAEAADLAIVERFRRRFGGIVLNDWGRADTRFALVAAGPSINLALLAIGFAVGRPGAGLVIVAWWSIVTAIFHAVRLALASEQHARGKAITPWRHR